MIAGKVEDMLNTVVRQIAFYTFERKVHEARRQGELTSDQLNAFWLEVQAESLGPAIELKPGYEVFWTYVPHFINSPFYVYAYAFGDCLVNSLYGLYQEAHPGFVAKYFDLLQAGGSKHHSELLAPFGLDASNPEFWQKGLKVIEGMIDELEAMDAPRLARPSGALVQPRIGDSMPHCGGNRLPAAERLALSRPRGGGDRQFRGFP